MSRGWAFLGATVVLGALATGAAALTLDAASVTIGGKQGATFRFRGRYTGALDAADPVVVTVDHAVLRVPLASFARKGKTLTYRGGRGAGRVSLLRLDLKRRRFVLDASGWPLDRIVGPFRLAVGSEDSTDCRLLQLGRRGKSAQTGGTSHKPQHLAVVTPTGADAGCDRLGTPHAVPVAVPAATATPVEFTVDLLAPTGVDTSSLRVVRADQSHATLCALAPAAGPLANRFTCTTTVTEAVPTTIPFAVEGRLGNATLLSPGATLAVVAPITDVAVNEVLAARVAAHDVWSDVEGRLGDSLPARMEAIRRLRAIDGILDADLSPDGSDIALRYATGWLGLLILNRPGDDAASPAPAVQALRTSPPLPPRPRGIFRSCDDGSGSGTLCCTPDRRDLLEGRTVLIWDPGFFTAALDDGAVAEAKFQEHACLGFTVTKIAGAAADVASVHQFPAYSTLVMSTHGGIDPYGRFLFATGERVTAETFQQHRADLDNGLVGIADIGQFSRSVIPVPKDGLFLVSEDYFTHRPVAGRFPENAIVYASACSSAAGHLANVFIGAFGAGAYFGFDRDVSQPYTTQQVAPQLFDGLLKHLRTTAKAYEKVTPKVDPFPFVEQDPVTNKKFLVHRFARFVHAGRDDIAYVDAPTVTPESPTLQPGEQAMLTVEAKGSGTCDLTHHWYNEGKHGHLEGGDDVQNTSTEMTYDAQAGAESGADGVGIEVFPPDSDEPIGVACDDVKVLAQCGDGVRQDPEECDGADAAACPGQCAADCTCTHGPPRVDVEIQGLVGNAGWQIVDADGTPPRIACPPTCSYVGTATGHGISRLRVFPADDPRTHDPPYDVASFTGCVGTTGLPAPGPSCFINGSTSAHVVVNLRYRPIVAVSMAGEAGQAPTVSGNPVDPFVGEAIGFACNGNQLLTQTCARHFPPGQGVGLGTASDNPPDSRFPIQLVSWDGPCAGQGIGPGGNQCTFVHGDADACITTTFRQPDGFGTTPRPFVGPTCPTGPGP